MPGEGADRFAQIGRALQWDRGRWIWLLAIVLSLHLVLALGDNVNAVLRYDRGAIAAGGWWRLLTAHIVHLDLHHLVLNELGLVLMWALFAEDYDAVEWCVIVCAGALAISCGLWWLSPGSAGTWAPPACCTRSWRRGWRNTCWPASGTGGCCSRA